MIHFCVITCSKNPCIHSASASLSCMCVCFFLIFCQVFCPLFCIITTVLLLFLENTSTQRGNVIAVPKKLTMHLWHTCIHDSFALPTRLIAYSELSHSVKMFFVCVAKEDRKESLRRYP